MAKTQNQTWKAETKSVVKRVLIGVVTAVTTTAVIYFLGFNRPQKKADELEIKKNTISVWKNFTKLENELQPKHDTLFARVTRGETTVAEHRRQDSLVSISFIASIKELHSTPNIDAEMKSLLRDRIQFKEEELQRFLIYINRFSVLLDTLASVEYKNFLIEDLNNQFIGARDNAVERMGRSMEDMLQALQKKYKYPFQVKDMIWYERYLQLKSIRQAEVKPDVDLPGM